MTTQQTLDTNAVIQLLPHRPPMLLIDGVSAWTEERISAHRYMRENDIFFAGHFPGNPMMPGVMMVEAIAQAGALLAILSAVIDTKHEMLALTGTESAKFRRPVRPGECLDIETTLLRHRRGFCRFSGRASVDGKLAAELLFTAAKMPHMNTQ